MTPRPNIRGLDVTMPPAEILRAAAEHERSRLPVFRESIDEPVGLVTIKDLFAAVARGETPALDPLIRPALFVPEMMPVGTLLREFQRRHASLALVVDEYGQVVGLITIEDVLEEIVGEVREEDEGPNLPFATRLPDGSYIIDGTATIRDLREHAGIPIPESLRYQTLAGFILDAARRGAHTRHDAARRRIPVDGPGGGRPAHSQAEGADAADMIPSLPLAAVERLLGARRGPARILDSTILKSWERNDVWRVRVTGGADLPAMVIVKQWKCGARARARRVGGPGSFSPRLAWSAPRFLGGDADARCFVMEDLGAGPNLEALLRDPGAGERAAAALVALARLTGRMHVDARGLAAEFDRRRDGLAPRPLSPAAEAARGLRERGADLASWLEAVGERTAAGTADALAALARFVGEPGDWTTVTHGDMAPGNTALTSAGWRLLDFEYAGVRPALYDALLWTLFCPFPASLIEPADRAYRETLAIGFAAARDDAAYASARARTAAWRTLDLLHWQSPALLVADAPWAPGFGTRAAVVWHLARFRVLAAAAPDDPAVAPIAAAARRLESRLLARWGPAPDAGSPLARARRRSAMIPRHAPLRHARASALPGLLRRISPRSWTGPVGPGSAGW